MIIISKKGLLIAAILSLIAAVILNAMWLLLLIMTMLLQAQNPGIVLSAESTITFYVSLVIGIIMLVVTIVLFVLRKKKNPN